MDTTRNELLETYRHTGTDLATVYVPTPSAIEDAEHRLEIRRKNVESELREKGAPDELVAAATNALAEVGHDDAPAHLLVVGPGGLVASRSLHRPVTKTSVHLAPVPALLPLLAATQTDVEHLAVLLDRTGADVMVRTGVADPIDAVEIDGPDVRVHRSHPGGWSQKRFQQTAENAWENNAKEVVDQIVADHPDIDIVICGGDERAVTFFVDHLPARFEIHRVDGSRHADPDAFLDGADVALRDREATAKVELLDSWRSARAEDRADSGSIVLDLLTQGRVDHLLVVDDTDSTERTSSTFDFTVPAHMTDGSDLVAAPITDGAVALAVATGADVTVVPHHPDLADGLGAFLRT